MKLGRAGSSEVLIPTEGRAESRQFRFADLVVDLFGIAARNQVERTLGQCRLELQDGGGAGLGLLWLLARQFQYALDVRHVFLAQFDRLGIFLQVILPIGQAQTTLVELRDHRIGVFEILTRTEFKQRFYADGLQVRYFTGDLGLVGELADAVEFRLEWGEASGVDGLFVHAGGIEVADLLGGGIAAGGGLGGRF